MLVKNRSSLSISELWDSEFWSLTESLTGGDRADQVRAGDPVGDRRLGVSSADEDDAAGRRARQVVALQVRGGSRRRGSAAESADVPVREVGVLRTGKIKISETASTD